MNPESKRLKVVLIPPEEWLPGIQEFVPGECPDGSSSFPMELDFTSAAPQGGGGTLAAIA